MDKDQMNIKLADFGISKVMDVSAAALDFRRFWFCNDILVKVEVLTITPLHEQKHLDQTYLSHIV